MKHQLFDLVSSQLAFAQAEFEETKALDEQGDAQAGLAYYRTGVFDDGDLKRQVV